MGDYTECPRSGHSASGGLDGGVYIYLHKCREDDCGTIFCNFGECDVKDDDGESACPECYSTDVHWEWDEAYLAKDDEDDGKERSESSDDESSSD